MPEKRAATGFGADGKELAAERGLVQHDAEDHRKHEEDQEGQRHGRHEEPGDAGLLHLDEVALAEIKEFRRVLRLGLVAEDHLGEARNSDMVPM